MKLEAPWPPSLNALWRTLLIGVCANCRKHAHATLRPSSEYEDYATQLKLSLLEQEIKPIEGTPALVLTAHFYRPRRTGDLDNMLKGMLDVMGKGRVYADDSQIVELHAYRHDDKARPRVELEVTELAAEQPALFASNEPAKQEAPAMPATSPSLAQERRSAPKPSRAMPQSLEQRLRNLAQPATITHRSDE